MNATKTMRRRSRVSGCSQCQGRKQRFKGHLDTFRQNSRLTDDGADESMTAQLKEGGPINVSASLSLTGREVQPGGRIAGSASIDTDATGLLYGPTDTDYCFRLALGDGVTLDIQVFVGGTRVTSKQTCMKASGSKTIRFTATAPSNPGTKSVTVVVRGANSGNKLAQASASFTVTGAAQGGAQTPCPEGFVFDPGLNQCVRAGDDGTPQGPLAGLLPDFGGLGGPFAGAFGVLFLIVLIAVAGG